MTKPTPIEQKDFEWNLPALIKTIWADSDNLRYHLSVGAFSKPDDLERMRNALRQAGEATDAITRNIRDILVRIEEARKNPQPVGDSLPDPPTPSDK